MCDLKTIEEIEARLIRDRHTLADLREREEQLLNHIPETGFCAEVERNRMRCENKNDPKIYSQKRTVTGSG
jgi:hypothetical protein